MSAPEAFEKARVKFLNSKELSYAHRNKILQATTIDDVYDETDKLQEEHAKSRKLRYLGKIKPFLLCLEQYSGVVETFVTVNSSILALIWSPIKLLLKMSSIYIRSFEKLVDVFARVGDCLPQFGRYAERFRGNNELHHILVLFYEDILDIYLATYKFVKCHVRQALVELLWPNLDGKLEVIQSNINRHKELFTHEVTLNVIIDAQHARTEALEHYEEVRKFETDKKTHDFMSFLSPNLYEGQIERIKEKRCDDTGCWIKHERSFKRWLDPTDQSASLLWLTGIPGAGKSFLSWEIITWLQNGSQDVVIDIAASTVIYAFFTYSDETKNPLLSAVHSFIYQVVLKKSELLPKLLESYASLQKLRDNQEYALSILRKLLDHTGTVYMLVDGLDECSECDRRTLLPALLELQKKCSNLRILISSQSEADISKLLGKTAVIQIGNKNHLNIESYVETQSIALLDLFKVGHSTDQGRELKTMLNQIAANAEGMFLYARLVMEHLKSQYYLRDVKAEANNLPLGLSEAYGRIMKRIINCTKPNEKSHVQRLFQWLCSAKRPIRQIELHHALLIRPGDRELDYHEPRNSWLDICGPIIETRGDTVVFVHFTAKGYLTHEESGPFITKNTAHTYAANICLTYLNLPCFDPHLNDDQVKQEILRGAYALYDYAWNNWLQHLQDGIHDGNVDSSLLASLLAFVKNQKNPRFRPVRQLFNKEFECLKPNGSDLYDGLCAAVFYKQQMQCNLQLDDDPEWFNKDPFLMSSTSTRIRSLLESLASPNITNSQTANTLGRFYGTRLFKCNKLACEYFRLGFETLQEKDEHMRTRHNRPFKCSNSLCDMSRIGFLTRQSLKSHEDLCLPNSPPDLPPQQHLAGTFTITPDTDDSSRWRMLVDAAHTGDQDVVAKLFNLGVYRSASSNLKGDLLRAAITSGSATIVDFILDQDKCIDLSQPLGNPRSMNSLQLAVYHSVEVAKRLLERGARVDETPTFGLWITETPLVLACQTGDESFVRLLLDYDPDINMSSDTGTPLMLAALGGHETVVELLLARYPGLPLDSKNAALDSAIEYAQLRTTQLLLNYGARLNTGISLKIAARNALGAQKERVEEILCFLVSEGADIRPACGSILVTHVQRGLESVVKMLLEAGADANAHNSIEETPLYSACLKGRESMITVLMQAGADPDIPYGIHKRTARQLAGFKKWAAKNPSLVPPIKSSTPGSSKKVRDGSHPDERDQENTSSSTPV